MSASTVLYIARMDRVQHGQGRRVLAVGHARGRSPLIQVTARSGDFYASARLEARRERAGEGNQP